MRISSITFATSSPEQDDVKYKNKFNVHSPLLKPHMVPYSPESITSCSYFHICASSHHDEIVMDILERLVKLSWTFLERRVSRGHSWETRRLNGASMAWLMQSRASMTLSCNHAFCGPFSTMEKSRFFPLRHPPRSSSYLTAPRTI